MEALYIKLYEKYSKLKAAKDAELDKINEDQEVKFVEFVSAAETLIEHLTTENKRLCQNIDELRNEVRSVRAAKDQQFDEFQEHLVEERQKNQKLSAEIEQLRNMQQEGIFRSNRTDQQEVQHVNNVECSPRVSGDQLNESPRRMTRKRASESSLHLSADQFSESPTRMTRKRAKLLAETVVNGSLVSSQVEPSTDRVLSADQFSESPTRMTRNRARLLADTAVNGSLVSSPVEQSTGRALPADHPKRGISKVYAPPQPSCCWSDIDSGGAPTCLFQNLVECLIGMKVSIVDQPEGRCIRAMHQSSGYSFCLTWMNKAAPFEGELLYNVSSLGTFAQVAPEWMREVIIFSMSMCPTFFERVSRVIKQL